MEALNQRQFISASLATINKDTLIERSKHSAESNKNIKILSTCALKSLWFMMKGRALLMADIVQVISITAVDVGAIKQFANL